MKRREFLHRGLFFCAAAAGLLSEQVVAVSRSEGELQRAGDRDQFHKTASSVFCLSFTKPLFSGRPAAAIQDIE